MSMSPKDIFDDAEKYLTVDIESMLEERKHRAFGASDRTVDLLKAQREVVRQGRYRIGVTSYSTELNLAKAIVRFYE